MILLVVFEFLTIRLQMNGQTGHIQHRSADVDQSAGQSAVILKSTGKRKKKKKKVKKKVSKEYEKGTGQSTVILKKSVQFQKKNIDTDLLDDYPSDQKKNPTIPTPPHP